jgi:hypothetical protein
MGSNNASIRIEVNREGFNDSDRVTIYLAMVALISLLTLIASTVCEQSSPPNDETHLQIGKQYGDPR